MFAWCQSSPLSPSRKSRTERFCLRRHASPTPPITLSLLTKPSYIASSASSRSTCVPLRSILLLLVHYRPLHVALHLVVVRPVRAGRVVVEADAAAARVAHGHAIVQAGAVDVVSGRVETVRVVLDLQSNCIRRAVRVVPVTRSPAPSTAAFRC